MIKKKVDIICPIYNQSSIIDNFLFFISKLDKEIFNIILVNDGSTDNTKYQIDDFILKNKELTDNFVFLNKKNAGAASARNMGLRTAVSDYVWFCDPDDIISIHKDTDIVELLSSSPDIVFFSFRHINKITKSNIVVLPSTDVGEYNSANYVKKIVNDRLYTSAGNSGLIYPWDKIIKKNLITCFFNEDLRVYEDQIFNFELLMKLSGKGKVKVVHDVLYEYITYPGLNSLSTSWDDIKTNNFIFFINFLKSNFPKDFKSMYARELLSIIKKTKKKSRFFTILKTLFIIKSIPNIFIYRCYLIRIMMLTLGV